MDPRYFGAVNRRRQIPPMLAGTPSQTLRRNENLELQLSSCGPILDSGGRCVILSHIVDIQPR
jgi:hypothetical protein